MRVFLTGAAGFIGSQVARILVDRREEVFALVRPTTSLRRLDGLEDRIRLTFGDLTIADEVEAALAIARPDICIHLAWHTEPGTYLGAARENLASLEAGVHLLRLLIDVQCPRVVLAGTCVEPEAGKASNPKQSTIYAASKLALHQTAERLGTAGLSTICAHIFHLYGPGEDERRLVPELILALLRGEDIEVTAGEQRRDYLHVTDVASALCAIADSKLVGTVDVCSGRSVPLRSLFALIGEETGRGELIRLGAREYDADEVFSIAGDSASLTNQTGWRPGWQLSEGIKQTVGWWRETLASMEEGGGNQPS
jgi:nucleoside-diphosphate-sugar epimerase